MSRHSKIKQVIQLKQPNPLVVKQYQQPYLDLFWRKVQLKQCDKDWFNKIKYMDFQKSHFGVTTETEQIRVYDDKIRQSDYIRSRFPQFLTFSADFLQLWCGADKQQIWTEDQWNCLRYVYGHFTWHKDKIRFKEGYDHIGTQIILPPMEFETFKNGQLIIIDKDDETDLIFVPDPKLWTYIIIPLGFRHTVERVQGIRYSFTQEIFLKEGALEKIVAKKNQ